MFAYPTPKYTVHFGIAGLTLRVGADLPITGNTFAQKFSVFQLNTPSKDKILLHHHFTLPNLSDLNLNQRVYRKQPWTIFRNGDNWIYLCFTPHEDEYHPYRIAVFNTDYTQGQIFSPNTSFFLKGNLHSLTLFPTDQILLAHIFADREACFLHAAGMIINKKGFLFVGHSEAGKSTISKILQDEGEILCDDRIIVRRWPQGFKIHGTWSHGEIPIVSNASAPLRAILLLEKAPANRLIPVEDRGEIVRKLPFFVVQPLVTADWWEKTLELVGQIAREVPVYRLQFDKSGQIREVLKQLV